jgi:hypothetical protein
LPPLIVNCGSDEPDGEGEVPGLALDVGDGDGEADPPELGLGDGDAPDAGT